ncbi:hypothetical protein AMD00_16425 [Viridibacillus arvi]|uniref:Uncharacterized protein n=1 Tax=Viridibacillus arvi TaxID=263475 RepID=A0A0M0LG41_9BACL|nr:hypothetical protein AMD00_16425 [Viridibacillus arvi]
MELNTYGIFFLFKTSTKQPIFGCFFCYINVFNLMFRFMCQMRHKNSHSHLQLNCPVSSIKKKELQTQLNDLQVKHPVSAIR